MDKPTSSSIDTIARTCIAARLRLLNRGDRIAGYGSLLREHLGG